MAVSIVNRPAIFVDSFCSVHKSSRVYSQEGSVPCVLSQLFPAEDPKTMALRLFWFLAGAGTATWWIKHHEQARSQRAVGWHAQWSYKRPEDSRSSEASQSHQPTERRWSRDSHGRDERQMIKPTDDFVKMKEERTDHLGRAVSY